MNILADASLPGLVEAFPKPFHLTLYQSNEEVNGLLKQQNVLLCRSTLRVNAEFLANNQLQFIATASSGTDHLDLGYLNKNNIIVLDAKGCNANSVADYVVSSIAYLEQENRVSGYNAAVIGLGAVGNKVSLRLQGIGFNVAHYDPLKAMQDSLFQSAPIESLYGCDLLCIHAELHDKPPYPSRNLIDYKILSRLKPGCIIINASRGTVINEKDMLNCQSQPIYCTDVYQGEPQVDTEILAKATLCTPHIAGHSVEAKYEAVRIVSQKLHTYLGLPQPLYAIPQKPSPIDYSKSTHWSELALALYNPIGESKRLKEASDPSECFVRLRKQHHTRHDFSTYFTANIPLQLQKIFGA
jgi:erythronate-4-phosphate dehydrogenase